jgi:16S rRNA (guanine966-N2)-methyltransferase
MGSNKSAGGARRAGPGGGRGYVRIIGGDWRGRKLPVAVAPGLRPSGDRGRETLFNWLQPVIRGARCADLFAGTGVLGFEAASRGAAEVWLVENAAPIAKVLRESARLLNAEQVSVIETNALHWLAGRPASSLDLVFIDPPFDTGLAPQVLETLVDTRCLAPGALVYLECPRLDPLRAMKGFVQTREKVIGEVRMQLLQHATGK